MPPRQFHLRLLVSSASLLIVIASVVAGQESPAKPVDFAGVVRPLLSDRCFACHGPDAEHRESDLRLDRWDSLIEPRGETQVVRPGEAEASELIRRITSLDESEKMPPASTGKPLSDSEIETLIEWIDAGAPWQQHWAYEQPRVTAPPRIDNSQLAAEAQNWIDLYIAGRLEKAGGQFSPHADLVTLARRLSFDLAGLPPSPEEIEGLLQAPSADRLDHYINRLLASPAFGERMAIYWLDLVRFADTVGYHGDQDQAISLYRDYVIDAFNDNRGFDQFTLEQIAGDLLPNPTDEQIIATGYNRMLQTSHEGGVQPKEYLTIYAADRVRNLSAVWMGATVGCAQCHDHKFDPYTAHDFYALSAFFADIDEAQHFTLGSNDLPTKRPPEEVFLDRKGRMQLAAAELANLSSEIERIQASARKTMVTVSIAPRTIRFLPRGNWLDDTGAIVEPAVPAFLQASFPAGSRPGYRPTRLDLARWLVDSENGVGLLTARVQVNRLWMLLFGHGLSRSVDDFGGQGEAASHPELLDRLAIELVSSGWDIKHMLRVMTASRTYRQSSLETDWHRQHDPQNRLLGRQNRFRISAEMIRDAALANAQLLVAEVGGPSIKPYQPDNYYRHLNFPVRSYEASRDAGQWRRGLYVHWQRQFLHPMLRAFDAPSREECTAQRPQSNTPLAALVWLNDPSFIEAARGLARRVLRERHDDPERIGRMFEIVTSRPADDRESELLHRLLERARQEYQQTPTGSQELLEVGFHRVALAEEQLHEWAAWTSVARAALNLNETYTRN